MSDIPTLDSTQEHTLRDSLEALKKLPPPVKAAALIAGAYGLFKLLKKMGVCIYKKNEDGSISFFLMDKSLAFDLCKYVNDNGGSAEYSQSCDGKIFFKIQSKEALEISSERDIQIARLKAATASFPEIQDVEYSEDHSGAHKLNQ